VGHERGPPKTRESDLEVLIESGAVRVIKEYLGSRTSGHILQTRNGTLLTDQDGLRSVPHPICDNPKMARGGTHAFRHSRVSHMHQNKVPPDFAKS
jgi:hypothetical protein